MKQAIKRKAHSSEDEPNRLTKKRKIEPHLAENLVLPRDVMIEIMEYLNSKELVPCSMVSRYWLACSRSALGWICLGETKLALRIADTYEDKVDNLFVSGGSDCFEVRLTPRPRRKLDDHKIRLLDGNGNLVGKVFVWSNSIIERYISEVQIDEPYSSNGWLLKIILSKKLKSTWDKYLVNAALYVNAKTFQRVVLAGQEFPKHHLIFERGVRPEIDKLLAREYERITEYSGAITHETRTIAEAEPEGLKEGVKFHRYQLNTISWMESVEANADKVPWKRSNTSVLFDLHTEKAVAPHNANEYSHSVKSKGGILADETGLGKTCEIIGLVLCSSSEQQFPEFDANGLFNTNATLVICPNDLAVQWEHELLKFTNLKVSMLAFPEHLKSVTYDDVVNSDILIMTAEMFKNSNYLSLGCGGSKINSGFKGREKRKSLVDKSLKELRRKRSRLSTVGPVLEHFHFKRIVVDEGHQVLADKFVAQYIYDLKKSFAWFVSSTPFLTERFKRTITKRAFKPVKKLLEIWDRDYKPKDGFDSDYDQYLENNCIVSNLLWRNTKESVKEEYTVPESIEEVIKMKFHPIEALVYKYAEKEDRVRLCDGFINWPLAYRAKNNMALDEFKDWKIASLKDDVKNLRENRTKSVASWSVHMEEQDEIELDEILALPYLVKGTKLKGKKLEHLHRVNKYGTKCAELMGWMSALIAKSSSNRFLLFTSEDLEYQTKLSVALRSEGIENVVIGGNIAKKSAALQQILKGAVQVALLNSHDLASGMSLNNVNYVVYLSTIPELVKSYYYDVTTEREHQLQVLNLVHRQGQDQKVTLIRFVVQDSVEEERYQKYQKLLARGDNSEEEDSEEEED